MINFTIELNLRGDDLEDFLAELDTDFYIGWNVAGPGIVELSILEGDLSKVIKRLAPAC